METAAELANQVAAGSVALPFAATLPRYRVTDASTEQERQHSLLLIGRVPWQALLGTVARHLASRRRRRTCAPTTGTQPAHHQEEITVPLPDDLLALLRKPSTCYLSTIMADGSPQITQTWVDTDGEHIVINTVQGFVKLRNIERDPRMAVALDDPADRFDYKQIRGRVVETTTEGGAEHIEQLSQKYTGQPYQWYGGRDQVRVILRIAADKISGPRG